MNKVTTTETKAVVEIVEKRPSVVTSLTTNTVSVSSSDSGVQVTPTETTVNLSDVTVVRGITNVILTTQASDTLIAQDSSRLYGSIIGDVVTRVDAVTEVEVVEYTVTIQQPTLALNTILDAVRTDAADTTLVYDGSDQLTSFTNNDVTKSFTYNPDGTIATATTVTGTNTVTKTFGYTDGNLTSITVS
jgi:YD repeat-containing protein